MGTLAPQPVGVDPNKIDPNFTDPLAIFRHGGQPLADDGTAVRVQNALNGLTSLAAIVILQRQEVVSEYERLFGSADFVKETEPLLRQFYVLMRLPDDITVYRNALFNYEDNHDRYRVLVERGVLKAVPDFPTPPASIAAYGLTF